MPTVEELTARAAKTGHGFKDLEAAAEEVVGDCDSAEAYTIAKALFESEVPQARCVGVFILGLLAAQSQDILPILRLQAEKDGDWRVQEIVAKAFDRFCADHGYEAALPEIHAWLADPSANVRRAVTEGLRIWTGRPYFRDFPDIAIALLAPFRNDPSDYLRKSVGNALRDISKKHPALVRQATDAWNLDERGTRQTYKLATRYIDTTPSED